MRVTRVRKVSRDERKIGATTRLELAPGRAMLTRTASLRFG
jgi:hypothetical protein